MLQPKRYEEQGHGSIKEQAWNLAPEHQNQQNHSWGEELPQGDAAYLAA